MAYTQQLLNDLLTCRKRIIEPPKRSFTVTMGSKRNGMRVDCEQGRRYYVFMRINEAFEENFSIGLKYEPPDSDGLILLRCNGPHGDYLSPGGQAPWHTGYHFHLATVENIDLGIKPEAGGTATTEYASYLEALRFFLNIANIEWDSAQFPALIKSQQGLLFLDDPNDDH